jgi:hypothetical protein
MDGRAVTGAIVGTNQIELLEMVYLDHTADKQVVVLLREVQLVGSRRKDNVPQNNL